VPMRGYGDVCLCVSPQPQTAGSQAQKLTHARVALDGRALGVQGASWVMHERET